MREKLLAIRTCAYCGKEVPIYHKNRLQLENVWCSQKCYGNTLRKENINSKCCVCGKSIHLKPSRLKKIKNPTCSKECMGELRKIIYKNQNNPNYGNRGYKNPNFKGNATQHCNYDWGYAPDHPFAPTSSNGRVRMHRLVAEQCLLTNENSVELNGKRYLKPEYDVHHIDGNKHNNTPANLMVLTRSEHSRLHMKEKLFHNKENK